jgi:16S rRNA (guanine966-N2)-methyltransferase
VRIIAGSLRGRRIIAPPGQATRPTADRVRETLFSMLTSRIGTFDGLSVADLFAGSGALGIEALSRGAATALFVENNAAALAALRRNLEALELEDRSRVLPASVTALRAGETADLVLADPPYGAPVTQTLLETLCRSGLLRPGGWLAIETARGEPTPSAAELSLEAERNVGKARLTLFRRSSPPVPPS